MFRTMRDIGFFNRIRPTAAFCQMLAVSSWHLDHLNNSNVVNDHLKYSLQATQKLQRELDDVNTSLTNNTLGAVLAFVCSAVNAPINCTVDISSVLILTRTSHTMIHPSMFTSAG
jgi:hypothetical protein